jgi:phenylpyruvate tautomerase PptA (4-oxalocrotonate tautomerase family)
MPFHRWYCPSNLYTANEKKAIAAAITDVYKRLPAFYVVVNFICVDKENFFVGGENSDKFVRICVHHLARTLTEWASLQSFMHFILIQPLSFGEKRAWMDKYEKAIEPWTKGKGIDWEVQIANMDVSAHLVHFGLLNKFTDGPPVACLYYDLNLTPYSRRSGMKTEYSRLR